MEGAQQVDLVRAWREGFSHDEPGDKRRFRGRQIRGLVISRNQLAAGRVRRGLLQPLAMACNRMQPYATACNRMQSVQPYATGRIYI
jgi:hypothetical protein